jgi:inorganic pyrophosphatase
VNIWHDIDPSLVQPDDFIAVIEIPSGSKKKYELDKKSGFLKLDRILYTSTHYPANYGFIPRTYAYDQDPLDVLVLCTESLDPMIMVQCYPIGVVRMIDCNESDDKIIAIPKKDPTWNFYRDINNLPPHISSEITHFLEVYKSLEHKHTTTTEVLGPEEAKGIIAEAMINYEKHFCNNNV